MFVSFFKHSTQTAVQAFGKLTSDLSLERYCTVVRRSLPQSRVLLAQHAIGPRKFSCRTNFSNNKLNLEITKALPKYNNFLKQDNTKKCEILINNLVDRFLLTIDLPDFCNDTISHKWFLLQEIMRNQKKTNHHSPLLPDFNLNDILNGTDKFSLPILLALQPEVFHFEKNFLPTIETMQSWHLKPPTFPFTATDADHESIIAIEKFILPALTDHVLVREMGCWNGESLIRLAFAASEKNIPLGGLVGGDINAGALQIGMALLNHLKIQEITLGIANVTNESFFRYTLPDEQPMMNLKGVPKKFTSDRQQLILAFRLLPVLNEHAILLLFSNLQKNTKCSDLLCFSYALPEGADYEEVIRYVESGKLRKETHATTEDLTVYNDKEVFQTYLSAKSFQKILQMFQFKQIESQQVGRRMVSLFQKID